MKEERIAIIGPGKVGQALARLLQRAGYSIAALGGRNPERVRTAAESLDPCPEICSTTEAAQRAGIVLLTVRDDAIEAVAAQCAFRPGATVIHFSGMHSSKLLNSACRQYGCQVASMHPLQTFATVEQAERSLPGSFCFIEGDKQAAQTAIRLAESLAMTPLALSTESKTLYHAAAVMACSGLTALLHAVEQVAKAAGISRNELWKSFSPLIETTLRNVRDMGSMRALTGPVARGDRQTVQSHLASLSTLPDERNIYRMLSDYAARTIACQQADDPEYGGNAESPSNGP